MDKSVEVSAVEPSPMSKARGGWTPWEPGDDLCPPWWPRRPRSPRGLLRVDVAQGDLRAADRIYAALTLLATTFVISDETLAGEVRVVSLSHLREGAEVLAQGAARAWEPGDEVCPPWPWGRYIATPPGDDAHEPRGGWRALTRTALPPRAADLLDGLSLLQAYALAARYVDPTARVTTTVAIGRALVDHAALLARAFA